MTGRGRQPRPQTTRRRTLPRAAAAGAGVALAVIAAACTSSGGAGIKPLATDSTRPTSSSPSSSTTSGPTTTTLDPTRAEIIRAYENDENVYLAVAGHYPIVPLDPRLPQVMTGTELITVRKNLTLAALAGQYASGQVDLAPTVTAVNGATAVISDCTFDHAAILNGRTGETITAANTQRTLQKVSMTLEGGVWKISDDQMMGSGCVPAV